MCRWPLRAFTPLQSILWPIIDPHLVTFEQICNFRDPDLVTFFFHELTHFFLLNEEHFTFHLQYTNILVCLLTVNMKNYLTAKNPKMCGPTLVTLLKMRPHYSQSSRENATPSSGTSPLASYKGVLPLPRDNCFFFLVFKLVTYLLTQPSAACKTQAVAFIHLSQVSWPTEISIGISLHLTANRL